MVGVHRFSLRVRGRLESFSYVLDLQLSNPRGVGSDIQVGGASFTI